jgi:hypothetical protein
MQGHDTIGVGFSAWGIEPVVGNGVILVMEELDGRS